MQAINPELRDCRSEEATLTVEKKPVTIQAEAAGKTYGDADPEFADASISDYIGKELEGIDLKVTRTNEDEDVNTYKGVLTIGKSADALNDEYKDYDFTVNAADFTISKANMTVSASTLSKVYDGSKLEGKATPSVTKGTTLKYSVKDGDSWSAWSEDVPSRTHAGKVTYKVQAINPNYETAESEEATLTVEKKPVTIQAEAAGKTYGDADPEFADASISDYIGKELEANDLKVTRTNGRRKMSTHTKAC